MAHQTALRIKKASFQSGITTIRSKKNLRPDGSLMGNYIVGQEGMDAVLTVQPGWSIKTAIYIDNQGYQAMHFWTEKD